MAIAGVVAASAVSSVAGSMISAGAAGSAADKAAAASREAAALQMQQYQQTRSDLLPYNTAGQQNLPAIANAYQDTSNALTTSWNGAQTAADKVGTATMAQLEATPGYQFQLDQGQRAVQASAAARGLGVSGAALKGGVNFASGLAASNYQNIFNQQNQNYLNQSAQFANQNALRGTVFNQMMAPATLGENAAAMTGQQGTQAAGNAGSFIQGAGQQQAAGITTGANNLASGLNQAGGAGVNYLALNNYLNNQLPSASNFNTAATSGNALYSGAGVPATPSMFGG